MGITSRRDVDEAQARRVVSVLETFIDECIVCALRQHAPEYAPPRWGVNDLHDAREALVAALIPIIAK